MAYRDILVHVGTGAATLARLDVAAKLAATEGSHLIGLHVRPPLRLPGVVVPDYGSELVGLHARYTEEVAAAARAAFDQVVQPAGLTAEWRDVTGDLLDVVLLQSRYVDLTVIGQSDQDEAPPPGSVVGEHRLADNLAMMSGGPVVVVPTVGAFATVGDWPLVAWSGSREAQRAVGDALPILRRAKGVTVLVINPREGGASHGDIPGADIGLHLARHGVNAVCESVRADDVDIGNMLLSRAADEGADLLVMGAYGRSQFREMMLGGVTRKILSEMTIPTLMAH